MQVLLKSYSLQNEWFSLKKKYKRYLILLFALILCLECKTQSIANYVNNGGFEEHDTTQYFFISLPKFWGAADTSKTFGGLLSRVLPNYLVPLSSYTYQWPRHGNNFFISLHYCSTCSTINRGYPRNRLKRTLEAGRSYCVSMYVNLSNQSTHAIDALGAYFGDSSIDTISRCDYPITYLVPQIVNPISNIISDTLNWVLIRGQFTALGNEKYMMIGNFKSDANTNTMFVNPANLPANASSYSIDDISCIDIDLTAFAGNDTYFIPGDTVFIGRQPDVGIDEACMWYQLPNMTTAIDTVAGLWVKPLVTTTYVVRQEICGNVKWDTIVLYQSGVGLNELSLLNENLRIYPVPAQEEITLSFTLPNVEEQFNKIIIYNNLGQVIREEEIIFKNKEAVIKTGEILNGVYLLKLKSNSSGAVSKRIVISK